MSNEQQTEEKKEKVMTKYDLKMKRRKEEEEKEKKSWFRFRAACLAVVLAVVVAIVASIGISVYDRYSALHGTYISVGGHDLTKVEYDYHFATAVNNYMAAYGSFVSLMGFDPSVDPDTQPYPGNEKMTWKDYFDQITVEQIRQAKALADDAAANGFVYDDTTALADFDTNFASAAEEASMSVSEYYSMYGEYATQERLRPFVKESLLVDAYYEDLLEQKKPTEEEIQAYYEENKQNYDTVDYRMIYFAADIEEGADEAAVSAAMEEIRKKAEEMAERRKDGEDFEELCVEYADEDRKENYGGETEGSYLEKVRNYSVPDVAEGWLFDESRRAGDLSTFADEDSNRYYVVEYLNRDNDSESTNTSISDTLSGEAVNACVTDLMSGYEVVDKKGNLKYLTLPEDAGDAAEVTEEAGEAAETETAE